MENSQILLDKKLICNIKGIFFVPSYQRGYRWGKDEVLRLLDDILDNANKNYGNAKKNYCLQPIVVRRCGNGYELIDGQQRLTTLYLIFRFMKNVNPLFMPEPPFELVYETRKNSEAFLRSVDLSRRNENIDFYFMANAYETIENWFNSDLQIRVFRIFDSFKYNVQIIWYEVGENEDAISLFTRLNIGKIPLTSAELVKAMFLSRGNNDKVNTEKQEEISLQWDNIEKELHNDHLWSFLTNSTIGFYQTRIDLILDLVSRKPVDNRDKYYTFFKISELRKSLDMESLWRKIQQTFLVLKDWYEDHELYHKIGYLIAAEVMELQEIFVKTEGKTKKEFRSFLDDCIRSSVDLKGNYAELNYYVPTDYKRLSRLLLLFNVESVRQNGEHSQWFPFDKFKNGQNKKVTWSLEHIHAQQSEGLQTQETWKEWLKLHMHSVITISKNEALSKEMQSAINKEKLGRLEFEALQQQVVDLLSVHENTEYLHSISNLALLRADDNAALNNSAFDVKRNLIIKMDQQGRFIPFCTRMVFLKYYTESDDTQLHFWSQNDRNAYVKSINRVLGNYLSEPISIEEEA